MILAEAVDAGCGLGFKARVDGRLHEKYCLGCGQRQAGCSTCRTRAGSGQAGDHTTLRKTPCSIAYSHALSQVDTFKITQKLAQGR